MSYRVILPLFKMTDSRLDFQDNEVFDDGLGQRPNLEKNIEQFNQEIEKRLQRSIFDYVFSEGKNKPKKPRELCPTPNKILNKITGKTVDVPCNRWTCPVCINRKAWRLRFRIRAAIKDKVVRHLILTIPDNSYDITSMFNNLRTQLRERGKLNEYLWVKEFQERGVRHLHVIIFEYIHFTEIDMYWAGKFKIKLFRGRSDYICKYLTDIDSQRNLFKKGERRYSSSQDFLEKIEKKASSGEWIYLTHDQVMREGINVNTKFVSPGSSYYQVYPDNYLEEKYGVK